VLNRATKGKVALPTSCWRILGDS